jgi:hypothetical protein
VTLELNSTDRSTLFSMRAFARSGLEAMDWVAFVFAACAAVWHGTLLTRTTNDNFLHLTLAQQLLAGEWPVRDFFGHGWVLQYSLSAAADAILGHRLLAESVVIGICWAIAVYVVFVLVRRLGGTRVAAVAAALMLIVCDARGYSYPKGIVYAVAALLWWNYLGAPSTRRAVALGAWAAVAFYWRPDHGVFVAAGIALAMIAAHGWRAQTFTRTAVAAVTMVALLAPFFVYVQAVLGLPEFVQTGFVQAEVEHTSQGPHEWPLLRYAGHIVTIAPAEPYAPIVGIRWSAAAGRDARKAVLARYGLTPLATDDNRVTRVRLSESSLGQIHAILNEPAVEDTAGIDRSRGTLSADTWPAWQRWSYRHALLRLRVLPALDAQDRVTELDVALLYAVPLLLIIASPWLWRHLSGGASPLSLTAFALFALLVDFAMLRHPFSARAPDGVVLPAVALGCMIAAVWQAGHRTGRVPRLAFRFVALVLACLGVAAVAGAGQFGERASVLTGRWRSAKRARAAWTEVYHELASSPPLAYYLDRPARVSIRLAAYVRACVPATDRVLVLWFEPEIYYYSDRLMAQRHLVFPPAWSGLPIEQRMTLDKVRRFAPPIALARRSALQAYTRATYPALMSYVDRQYRLSATFNDDGEEYEVLARRDRAPVGSFGPQQWPCYSTAPSPWSRVGRRPDAVED